MRTLPFTYMQSADGPRLTPPTVVTGTINTTTYNSAAMGGSQVTSDGGVSVTARGITWSTSVNPTIALATKTNNGSGLGTFSSDITGLTQNTTYYVRAYATNSIGTGYGNQVQFTTPFIPANTFLGQFCDGFDLRNSYADGSGGSYSTLAQSNSATCGYCPPYGTLIDTGCAKRITPQYGIYTSGNGQQVFDVYADGYCGYYATPAQPEPVWDFSCNQ